MTLLMLLYDGGACMSKLCGLTIRDIRLDEPAVVILKGKGYKIRVAPLMRGTVGLIAQYREEIYLELDSANLDVFARIKIEKVLLKTPDAF